ncbi:hypothetical protein M3650_06155 [Paenibacillus sp. MER TA 81-3]|uniref:hypothetical protein n=1 Tax=Paenibacillus sp. MER TA 81-3 TaxID=2939573 RepID=UPI0020422A93|nr:hypothetical protein [Paenibacillus sp. MER TA 81-3]MCM3338228.1 hypothetical protein [Paenibacillus sp. MER TA 81-3]
MGANRAVGALEAWMDHRLSGMAGAQLGTIIRMGAADADVELDGEAGLIRYQLPVVQQASEVVLEAGSRVLVVFTEANGGGGVIVGKVAGE